MANFINQTCEVCGKPFVDGDDIVVCPECGTPHHRECWFSQGNCINSSKHGSGFEWKPVIIAGVNDGDIVKGKNNICPRCGAENAEDVMFCENCGRPLRRALNTAQSQREADIQARIEAELSGEIDGIPVKEIALYIGPNAQYYIHKFRRMDSNPKYKPLSIPVIFAAPLMMFYRKMFKYGIACGIVNLICSFPTIILQMVELGYISSASPLVFSGIEAVGFYLAIAELIIGVVLGFLFEPIYKRNVIADIKKIKAENPDQKSYYTELMNQSGPSKTGKIICIVFIRLFIISML